MPAHVKLKLKPLTAPNFAIVDLNVGSQVAGSEPSIPVSQLDHDALEDLAYGWLTDFYKKAGKTCPFWRPEKCEPA